MFIFAELDNSNLLWQILEPQSNLINWLLLVGIIAWFANKYLPSLLAQRKEAIEADLNAAAGAKENALKLLADQKQKVADADSEAEKILVEAKEAAEQMRLQIARETQKDTADLLKKFENALVTERTMAISQMRAVAIRAAIKLTKQSLRSAMTEQVRARLLTQFVGDLDNISEPSQVMRSGQFEVHIK